MKTMGVNIQKVMKTNRTLEILSVLHLSLKMNVNKLSLIASATSLHKNYNTTMTLPALEILKAKIRVNFILPNDQKNTYPREAVMISFIQKSMHTVVSASTTTSIMIQKTTYIEVVSLLDLTTENLERAKGENLTQGLDLVLRLRGKVTERTDPDKSRTKKRNGKSFSDT